MDHKEILKDLIKQLHAGEKPEVVKEKFKEIIKNIDSKQIAEIEETLIKEGMPREEIQKLCDVHLEVFKESLNREKVLPPVGHPIHILMKEHELLLKMSEKLKDIATSIERKENFESVKNEIKILKELDKELKHSESHYVREENVLFPYLEKHGITEPPAIMWMEHDKIRAIKKNFYKIIADAINLSFNDFVRRLNETSAALTEMLSGHFYKENNILFPTGLKVISDNEWLEVRAQFDEIGYCCFTPEATRVPIGLAAAGTNKTEGGIMIDLDTGNLSPEEIQLIFNSMPVDITFVDKDDSVRYFSQTKERIFPRTKAVIGRKVQQCHPQKSLHAVNQILNDFRSNERDTAEFWINLGGKIIYIRYFAVRNAKGEYLGCLEVTQDITEIQKITGEKRLL